MSIGNLMHKKYICIFQNNFAILFIQTYRKNSLTQQQVANETIVI